MWTIRSIRVALLLFPLFITPAILEAQDSRDITFGGQIRPRFEARTPIDGEWNAFTSMRVRANLNALLEDQVRVFIQLQDVRLWGDESNTLGDYRADNFDLHQGFIELADVPSLGGALKIGRQEIALGEQRLVGSVNWAQQGRSFDGIRYTTAGTSGPKLDLFFTKLREETANAHDWESSFAGAYGTLPLGNAGTAEVYWLLTTDGREENGSEVTFGGLWRGMAGPVDFRVEGSLQRGERGGTSVSAYMFAARAGGKVHESTTVTLWYDYLSGDSDPNDAEIGVFNTLFATNHAFYGAADFFLNIPVQTGGLGLRDAAVKFAFVLTPKNDLRLDIHNFTTAQEGTLTTRSLANEVDLTITHRLSSALSAMAGFSYVQAKDGMEELGRLSENSQWVFVMLNAGF